MGEAQRYLEQAAGLADDPRERAAFLDRAGWLGRDAGDLDAATRLLSESIALYEGEGETHAAARVSGRLAYIERFQGSHDASLARAERAFEIVAGDEPDEDLASLATVIGSAYAFAGEHERATERLEYALDVAESLGSADLLARLFSAKAVVASSQGHREEALAFLKHGLAIALEHELWEHTLNLYFNLSDNSFQRDRYTDALGYLGEALEVVRRRGSRWGEWSLFAEMTYPLHMTGRWEEALACFAELPEDRLLWATTLSVITSVLEIHLHRGQPEEAQRLLAHYAEFEQSGEAQERSCYLAALAALHRAEGRYDDALAAGAEAAELARSAFGPSVQAVKQGLVEAVEAALALGRRDRAEELLATIDTVAPGLMSPYLEAQAHRFRGRLAASEPAAETSYSHAADRFRELDIPFWRAVTLLEHGEWLGARDRAADAEPLLAEAREVFEQLHAAPWVERVAGAAGAEVSVSTP